ncbi:MAG: FAD:protein FMN transferase [Bacillota bacterium]
MGTVVYQKIYGDNARPAYRKAALEIDRLEKLMSFFIEDSDVSRLNSAAGNGRVKVSHETLYVMEKSNDFAKLSKGAFDITIGPVVKAWREMSKQSKPPSRHKINKLLKLVGHTSLITDKNTGEACLERKGQAVDLGGVGKGFAADRVVGIYKELGVKSAFVNLGGNVMVVGRKPGQKPWLIGIQHPRAPRGVKIGVIMAQDVSVVTSGDYERFYHIKNKKYHHILDPRTGFPADSGLISTTIVCENSLKADVLSTACFVLGLEEGMALANRMGGAEALFITKHKDIYITEGLKDSFFLTDESYGYRCFLWK